MIWSDSRYLQRALDRNPPPTIVTTLQHLFARIGNKTQRNAALILRVAIHPDALNRIRPHNFSTLRSLWDSYLLSIPEPCSPASFELTSEERKSVVKRYQYNSDRIVTSLIKVLSSRESAEEKVAAFASLRYNDLFGEVGLGFLLSLIQPSHLPDVSHIQVSFRAANEQQPIFWEWGTPVPNQVYSLVQKALGALGGNWSHLWELKERSP